MRVPCSSATPVRIYMSKCSSANVPEELRHGGISTSLLEKRGEISPAGGFWDGFPGRVSRVFYSLRQTPKGQSLRLRKSDEAELHHGPPTGSTRRVSEAPPPLMVLHFPSGKITLIDWRLRLAVGPQSNSSVWTGVSESYIFHVPENLWSSN